MERTLGTIGIDMCFATTEAPKPMVVHAAAFCRSERELQFGRAFPLNPTRERRAKRGRGQHRDSRPRELSKLL